MNLRWRAVDLEFIHLSLWWCCGVGGVFANDTVCVDNGWIKQEELVLRAHDILCLRILDDVLNGTLVRNSVFAKVDNAFGIDDVDSVATLPVVNSNREQKLIKIKGDEVVCDNCHRRGCDFN